LFVFEGISALYEIYQEINRRLEVGETLTLLVAGNMVKEGITILRTIDGKDTIGSVALLLYNSTFSNPK
jgi:hypothetical protein